MQWLPATDYLSQVDGWIIIIMANPNAPLISEPDGTPADQPNRVYYPSGINISILSTIAGREHHHKNLHLLKGGQLWNSTLIVSTPTHITVQCMWSIPHEKRKNDHFWNKLLWDFKWIAKINKDWSFKNHQDISADPPFDTEGWYTQSKRLLKDSYSSNN